MHLMLYTEKNPVIVAILLNEYLHKEKGMVRLTLVLINIIPIFKFSVDRWFETDNKIIIVTYSFGYVIVGVSLLNFFFLIGACASG